MNVTQSPVRGGPATDSPMAATETVLRKRHVLNQSWHAVPAHEAVELLRADPDTGLSGRSTTP